MEDEEKDRAAHTRVTAEAIAQLHAAHRMQATPGERWLQGRVQRL